MKNKIDKINRKIEKAKKKRVKLKYKIEALIIKKHIIQNYIDIEKMKERKENNEL